MIKRNRAGKYQSADGKCRKGRIGMTRLYYCRECGCRFESNDREDVCIVCDSEDLMLEANFDGCYVF